MAESVRQDLKKKLQLEKQLEPSLRQIFDKVVSDYARLKANTGRDLDASSISEQISMLLGDHYENVSSQFDDNLQKQMPSDLRLTPQESDKLQQALLIYFSRRKVEQSKFIVETTNDNILQASEGARQIANEQAATNPMSQPEIAMTGAAILSRSLLGRISSIAITETNTAAETTKAAEAAILVGQEPSIAAPSSAYPGTHKEWVTVGDEVVRPAHKAADGQIVPSNESFEVGGERLGFPGDTSLGASLGNIINCRCGVRYVTKEIIDKRSELLNISVDLFGPILSGR